MITNPFNGPRTWTQTQVQQMTKGWWTLLVAGVASVVAGGIIVINDWTVGDLAVFLGALLIFRGFFTLFSFPIDGSARTSSIIMGLLELGAGLAIWVWPGQTLLVVAFFIGWYLLFQGILAISGSIAGRGVMPYWGWILALGIVQVLVSFYLLARPALTLVAAILAIGLSSVFYGVVEIALAFEIKNLSKDPDGLEAAMNTRHLQGTRA
jgi:uncharacterized membrane protein HdeD (DUF308 family)